MTLQVQLISSSKNPRIEMVLQMLEDLAPHAGFTVSTHCKNPNAFLYWGTEPDGWQDLPCAIVPYNPEDAIPKNINLNSVQNLPMPAPGGVHLETGTIRFRFDLFSFLAGQLYRAEEYFEEHSTNSVQAISDSFLGERFSFFDRPIVDLWLRELGRLLFRDKQPKPQVAKVWMTHDVDILRKWTLRSILGQTIKTPWFILSGKFGALFRSIREIPLSLLGISDPFHNISHILESEKNSSTFFFLGYPRDHIKKRYDIRKSRYFKGLKQCVQNNQSIGLHGSPLHFQDQEDLKNEKIKLEQISHQEVLVSRQHYLYTDLRKTLSAFSEIGIQIDSSLGFNNRSGFRCGTCFPFRWWNHSKNEALSLIEMPLILGEFQLHDPSKNFDVSQSLEQAKKIVQEVKNVGGVLSLLLHNVYYAHHYFPKQSQFNQILWEYILRENFRSVTLSDIQQLILHTQHD